LILDCGAQEADRRRLSDPGQNQEYCAQDVVAARRETLPRAEQQPYATSEPCVVAAASGAAYRTRLVNQPRRARVAGKCVGQL